MSRYKSYDETDYTRMNEFKEVIPPNNEVETVSKPIEGKIVNTPLVRVRKKPDLGGEVVDVLNKGDSVTVTETVGDFLKISFYGSRVREGYILSKFFKEE